MFAKLNQQCRDGRGQIEEVRSSLESQKSHGQVLHCLMEQRDAGNIPGIYGRLVCGVCVCDTRCVGCVCGGGGILVCSVCTFLYFLL